MSGKLWVFAVLALNAVASAAPPDYKRPDIPIDRRIDDLLGRMTLEEKVAQLGSVWEKKGALLDAQGAFAPAKASEFIPHGIGQIARPADRRGIAEAGGPNRSIEDTVALVNAAQKWATTKTRLGIPILFHAESLHGLVAPGATSFPQAIALASTWDPPLLEKVFSVVARETRVTGSHLVLAPVIDVARDARWGRIEETYGEDPFLVAELGIAAIRGYQGDTLPLGKGKVLATLKHMAGHGQPEAGINVGPAMTTERVFRDVILYPFEQAVMRTKVLSVMPSYNEVDGIPSHVNRWMLTDVLRGEWGFQGALVSDYFAINELIERHHVASTLEEAAARALHAGVDSEMPDTKAFATLISSVQSGKVAQADIDAAVRRILRLKFEAGLFENPYAKAADARKLLDNADARALALDAARRSVVLLKNEGRLLPLDSAKVRRLAVIGPNSAETILGGYSDVPRRTVSILEGLRARLKGKAEVVHAQGVRLTHVRSEYHDDVQLVDPAENAKLIQEAVAVAKTADTIVLAIGDNETTTREAWADNHLGDRADITLVGQQQDLADALLALGKPLVVVLINGKPLAIPQLAEKAPAILEGWYLGQETGTAIADILFGDANPGGKLPVTLARSVGHLPAFYNYKPTARRGYLFDDVSPLYPFGYGLSYTRFEMGEPRLSAARIASGEGVTVTVNVKNVGDRAGDEVVQVYVQDVTGSITRPVRELKGFQRVALAPGEQKDVVISLPSEAFAFTGLEMKRIIEPGLFHIMAGANSRDVKTADLTIQ